MEYRTLGSSGLRVSVAGLGCNNLGGRIDLAATKAVVAAALNAGITFFDTACICGDGKSEEFLGQALGSRRKDVVIATKFGMERDDPESGGSRRYVMSAVETSLKALGTDWIDLYQLHQSDPRTPIEETLDALDTLVDQGNARYAGCSNCMGWQIADAQWTAIQHGFRRFVSAQNQWACSTVTSKPRSCRSAYASELVSCRTFRSPRGFSPAKSGAGRNLHRTVCCPPFSLPRCSPIRTSTRSIASRRGVVRTGGRSSGSRCHGCRPAPALQCGAD